MPPTANGASESPTADRERIAGARQIASEAIEPLAVIVLPDSVASCALSVALSPTAMLVSLVRVTVPRR